MFIARYLRGEAVSSVALFVVVAAVFAGALYRAPDVFAAQTAVTSITFKAPVANATREATVEPRTIDGVAYVPVNAVLQQFGGGATVLAERVELDFLGKSAWVRLDNNSVNASLKEFQLSHNILRDNRDILMALADVVSFFEDAFGARVSFEAPAAEKPQESISEPEAVVMEDLSLPDASEQVPLADIDSLSTRQQTSDTRVDQITVVAIDAGHGGTDPGCQSSAIQEKDLTLAIAQQVASLLQASFEGRAILTRSQDASPSLQVRARLANAQNADLMISVHAGASMSPSAHGFELFVPPDARLSAALGNPEVQARGAAKHAPESAAIAEVLARKLAEATGAVNRGIRVTPCRLFDEVNRACLVVEVGSLTNREEATKLADQAYQTKIAEAIADAVRTCAGRVSENGATP